MKNNSLSDQFTNRYPLSKTLRFELKPVSSNGKRFSSEESSKVFEEILEQDRKIKAAYDALKPVLDKIHEEIITNSLKEAAQSLDFSEYWIEYQKGKDKKLEKIESELRLEIGKSFANTIVDFNKNAKKTNKKGETKPFFKMSKDVPFACAELLDYVDEKSKNDKELQGHIEVLKSFFTYFTNYNTNRANYYEFKKKADTSVASRTIHDNLPFFCDNALLFNSGRKDEYLYAYNSIKELGKITQIKDAETDKMIELKPIDGKMFDVLNFSNHLTQSGIEDYNTTIGHYNALINLYNQSKGLKKNEKLKPFKELYKQIGCGEKKTLYDALKFDKKQQQIDAKENSSIPLSVEGTLEIIAKAGNKYFAKGLPSDKNYKDIHDLIDFLRHNADWEGIYWSKSAIDIISNKYLINWHDIKERIVKAIDEKGGKQKLISVATYDKKREEQLKINDAVELSGLFDILNQSQNDNWTENFFKNTVLEDRKDIINVKLSPSENLINLICADMEDLATNFISKLSEVLKITDYKNEEKILKIKEWLDTAKFILWNVKYFDVKPSKVKGNSINSELAEFLNTFLNSKDATWFNWYDLVRNYLTKKPQDDVKKNKLKLNFKNPNLVGGWSDGEEKNKGTVLLKNGNKYYVGILNDRNIFNTAKKGNPIYEANEVNIGRLILRSIAFKTLSGKGFVSMFGENYGEIGKRNPTEAVTKLQKFIKEYIILKDKKTYLEKYPKLTQVVNKTYSDKKIFDKEVQDVLSECYECDFTPVDWNIVLQYVGENKNNTKPEDGKKLYLFEIYSKDFSDKKGERSKNSRVNLQTMYWEHIFQEHSTIQLNGGGELFFREKAAFDKIVFHEANEKIYRRSDGKTESLFSHRIIKDKRFTEDKFFFHIPIKINYLSNNNLNFNESVNDNFTQSDNIQLLGIDRGEKHLIYFSLIDTNGKILKQGHLDKINGTDYLNKINEAAKKRREKQENWQQKGNISNLKDGYISLVVHEIIQKMKDKDGNFIPTFIVMEDLNTGFKQSRQKFEQQVYQKFELALAKKLNYLVDKNVPDGEIGSVSKALQLTPPVTNYQDIENRKQVGVVLYTRANYTSVTDPATGWRKTIYLKKGSEADIKKQILTEFTEIGIDINGDYYFEYPQKNTESKVKLWSSKNGKSLDRYRFKRGNSKNEPTVVAYDLKDLLDQLFKDFNKSESLYQQLRNGKDLSKINEHPAWESLRFVIDIIQQIRNSGDTFKGQDDNFLQSPIRNEQGEHYDSRDYRDVENPKLPKDADANGAYNIARKGIIMFQHIKKWVEDGKEKGDLDLFISDEEWDLWHNNKNVWNKQLKEFASRSSNQQKQQKPKLD